MFAERYQVCTPASTQTQPGTEPVYNLWACGRNFGAVSGGKRPSPPAFYFIAKSGDANGATTMYAPTVPLTPPTTAPNPLSTPIRWKYGIESNADITNFTGPPY